MISSDTVTAEDAENAEVSQKTTEAQRHREEKVGNQKQPTAEPDGIFFSVSLCLCGSSLWPFTQHVFD
jgi:hypothetical protein